jgi:mRNA interferase MazF
MKRGDLVIVALAGDLGKPRPALVVQADAFDQTSTAVILPISGTLIDAPLIRITMDPTETNGLKTRSQVMVDKITLVRRDKANAVIGHLAAPEMLAVNRALAVFLAIA